MPTVPREVMEKKTKSQREYVKCTGSPSLGVGSKTVCSSSSPSLLVLRATQALVTSSCSPRAAGYPHGKLHRFSTARAQEAGSTMSSMDTLS